MMVCLYLSAVGDTICLLDPQTTEDIPNPCVSSCILFNSLSMEILCISCIPVISYFNNCVFLCLQFDGPGTSRAFDDETVSVDTEMPQLGYLLSKMWNGLDASAVFLFYTNRPNYHQYSLLQVATGTQIPAAKSEVSNSSHYHHYLHTLLLTGTFPLSQDVELCTNGNFYWV